MPVKLVMPLEVPSGFLLGLKVIVYWVKPSVLLPIPARFWVPLTVAADERVIVPATLSMLWIVDPGGMPTPVMVSRKNRPVVLLTSLTTFDPNVSVPVKRVGAVVTPDTRSGMEGSLVLTASW